MKRCVIALLAFAVLASGTVSLTAQDNQDKEAVKDAEYYPLKVGTTWDYAIQGTKATVKVARHEQYKGVPCAVIETSIDGNVVGTEHVSADKDGVYRNSAFGFEAQPPVLILKQPYQKGQKWNVKSKMGPESVDIDYTADEEELTVPAGKYRTIFTKTTKFQSGGQEMQATSWYAKDVGIVKQILVVGGDPYVIELEKFTPGPAPAK